jgi:phosphoglycerate dehydrogenase-like enzyme
MKKLAEMRRFAFFKAMGCCFNLNKEIKNRCFDAETLRKIGKLVEFKAEAPTELTREWLKGQASDCDIMITGWDSLPLDREILDAAPGLKLVLHSAGSIRGVETPEMWRRGIRITSAANMNGVPVAEFLLGQILMCFKDVFGFQHRFKNQGRAAWEAVWKNTFEVTGYYQSTVGIIGMGNVGKHLLKLLQAFELKKLVHSFYPFEKEALAAGAALVEIDEIMRASDAVVLLAPNIPEYRRMIDARRLALMKDGAFFLNSSRGALVDEAALIAELKSGRITACIDVTDPEPPVEGSPFYNLPNCILTPHIAGSIGRECHRLGNQVLNELRHHVENTPFDNEITEELLNMIG